MGINFDVQLAYGSDEDFQKLDGSQKIQVLKSFTKIEQHGMLTGERLKGKLSDCNKLKHKRLGLRVIFREHGDGIEVIEIVVVGKRTDAEVYTIAEKRLGR